MLTFVGHGYNFASPAEELNIGKQTAADIVFEVTDAIYISGDTRNARRMLSENTGTTTTRNRIHEWITCWNKGAKERRAGDAGVFRNSSVHTFFKEHDHLFPETTNLGVVGPVQYHVLVYGGFAQGHRYIRPSPEPLAITASKRRFNRKHSGARRMIESSFGILCKGFSILQKDLQVEPEKASKLVTSMLVFSLAQFLARRQDLLEHVQR
ncbi:hypothetical protein Aduo_019128 [Ancylostoma duodenale]